MVVWKQYLKSFASSFELSIAPKLFDPAHQLGANRATHTKQRLKRDY